METFKDQRWENFWFFMDFDERMATFMIWVETAHVNAMELLKASNVECKEVAQRSTFLIRDILAASENSESGRENADPGKLQDSLQSETNEGEFITNSYLQSNEQSKCTFHVSNTFISNIQCSAVFIHSIDELKFPL